MANKTYGEAAAAGALTARSLISATPAQLNRHDQAIADSSPFVALMLFEEYAGALELAIFQGDMDRCTLLANHQYNARSALADRMH